jgi:Tfp pilus assembly PilM family ATPase
MRLIVIEMGSLALERSLVQKVHHGETIAIIDFGFRMTNLSVFDRTGLRYTHTIDIGGSDVTHALMRALSCSKEEAERLKLAVGLTGSGTQEVHDALRSSIDELLNQLSASMTTFKQPISKVLITGGGARLRGIRTAAQAAFGMTVHRGIPWLSPTHANKGHLGSATLDQSQASYYATALGLALRGMNRYTLSKGINFLHA